MSTKLNFSGKIRLIIRNGVGNSGLLDENNIIIKALKKLEDYKRIGTRQQCRKWKDRQTPKYVPQSCCCGTCGTYQPLYGIRFCQHCGQALCWNKEKEESKDTDWSKIVNGNE